MASTAVAARGSFYAIEGRQSLNGRTTTVVGFYGNRRTAQGSYLRATVRTGPKRTTLRVRTIGRRGISGKQGRANQAAFVRSQTPNFGPGYRTKVTKSKGILVPRGQTKITVKKVRVKRGGATRGARGNGKPPQLSRAQRAAIARKRSRDSRGKFR